MAKPTALLKLCHLFFFLVLFAVSSAQKDADSSVADISDIITTRDINPQCRVYVEATNGEVHYENALPGSWHPLSDLQHISFIPDNWITKPIHLEFTLNNRAEDTQTVYFLPGMYVKNLHFTQLAAGKGWLPVKTGKRSDGYQAITLTPGEQQTYRAKLVFAKRSFNNLEPILIDDSYLKHHKTIKHYRYSGQSVAGYLLSGILLMMILFTAVNFIQTGKKEFLYNCCYSFCMFALVFFSTYLERKNSTFSSFFHEYLDFFLLATGIVFYLAFTRKFLDTKTHFPLLHKIFVNGEVALLGIAAFYSVIVFFTDYFTLQKLIENCVKSLGLIIGIAFILIALSHKNKLLNYLAVGNGLLVLFSLISYTMILSGLKTRGVFSSAMMYYELGIVSELIFFLLGLTYKNRVALIEKIKEQESLKREAEKLSFESRLAVLNAQQAERNRISADMHDDLGAGVTAIRLYSELAKKRMGSEKLPEIEKISASANDLLNNMNAIIWTMSSSNDTLDNMIAYIRGYALEYFENTGISCHIEIDENMPAMAVSGEIRRNIFLVVKEALNNILKHANATEVKISLKRERETLSLFIHDNGKGIDFTKLRRFGNGLINMKKRLEESQITFSIENKNGTLVSLHRKIEI